MSYEIEKYFLKIKPEQVFDKIVKERISEAESNLELAEKLIKESLGDKVNGINLPLLIGNSVKSFKEFIEFYKLLENKGMDKETLNRVRDLISEARILLGAK